MAVARRREMIDARHLHQTRSWVVSFLILSEFGRDSGSREGTGLAVVLSRAREVRGRAGGAGTGRGLAGGATAGAGAGATRAKLSVVCR